MTTRMLVNANVANELRIAIVVDGELEELDIEATEQSTIKGNIYKGVVHNVEASLAAAFVDFGAHKQGFLPFDEIAPSQYARKWTSDDPPRITDVMRRGQEIVIQVAKDAVGEKGATLTTHLSIASRYTVLMPDSDAGGVSRKIDDEKMRKRVRAMAAKVERPENMGFIVRTAGLGQTRQEIQKDLDAVVQVHAKMAAAAGIARAPSLLYCEPDLIVRTLRDYFTEDIDEVWIDNREEYEAARAYFEEVMPKFADRLHRFQDPIPIFAYHRVEEQIEATFERIVPLPSGGSIVVDETEALVAVDVNSGKMTSEKGHEDTVFKTNCEAAEELAKQLKLRDLGGIVVVDFIDMEVAKHKREVEKVVAEAAKHDKARYKISRINSKGLCVLTRQRIRQGMRKAFQARCEVCEGTGWRRTPESHSLSLLRRVETRLAQGGVGEVRVVTHRETAEYLCNFKRRELLALERQFECRILIQARSELDRGKDEVTYISKGQVLQEITDRLPPREERRLERSQRGKRKRKKRAQTRAASSRVELVQEESTPPKKRRARKKDASRSAPPKSKTPPPSPPAEGPGGATFTGKPPPELLAKLKSDRLARRARRASTNGVADPETQGVVALGAESEQRGPPDKASKPQRLVRKEGVSGGGTKVSRSRPAARTRPRPPREEGDAEHLETGAEGADGAKGRSLLDRIFGSR